MRRRTRDPIRLLAAALVAALGGVFASAAEEADPEGATVLARIPEGGGEYAEGGEKTCLKCHDETEAYPVLSILATPHGVRADARTPMAHAHACQTCHGPSADHIREPEAGEERIPVAVVFGPDTPADAQNQVCLSCHQGGNRMHWAGSQHDLQDVSCVDCHTVHAQEDPMLVKNIDPMVFARAGQAQVCFGCHPQQRAQIQQRVSSHPLREGKLECSSCHAPHGSIGPELLKRTTLNETCYQCHAEKRGPFLWEHAPVREDCGICHTPHGSNHPVLLKTRMPQLCQQCHMAQFHPSTAYGGPNFATPNLDIHALGQACLNCHSEIHGSNHPSGVRWTR